MWKSVRFVSCRAESGQKPATKATTRMMFGKAFGVWVKGFGVQSKALARIETSRSAPAGGADQGTESSDDREGAGVGGAQEPGVRGGSELALQLAPCLSMGFDGGRVKRAVV